MSNQAEHEEQQPETVNPQELRQFLIEEIEASQQAISELSDEQLEEIAGGRFSDGIANARWMQQQGKMSGITPRKWEVAQGFLQGLMTGNRIR